MSGADCTPAPDVTHRHIRGDLGLHCAGGRAGTGDGGVGLFVRNARMKNRRPDMLVALQRLRKRNACGVVFRIM